MRLRNHKESFASLNRLIWRRRMPRKAPLGNGGVVDESAYDRPGNDRSGSLAEPELVSHFLAVRRVRAAFFAAADRSVALRRRAASRACPASAGFDAACLPSLFSAWVVARLRLGDDRRLSPSLVRAYSRLACCRVFSGTVPLSGGGSFTPARRALERPMAIACLVERAPCFPSRMCSISSRTNSPAWVDGALPCRFALRARSTVFFSGIT
jgi:hypothetical protein